MVKISQAPPPLNKPSVDGEGLLNLLEQWQWKVITNNRALSWNQVRLTHTHTHPSPPPSVADPLCFIYLQHSLISVLWGRRRADCRDPVLDMRVYCAATMRRKPDAGLKCQRGRPVSSQYKSHRADFRVNLNNRKRKMFQIYICSTITCLVFRRRSLMYSPSVESFTSFIQKPLSYTGRFQHQWRLKHYHNLNFQSKYISVIVSRVHNSKYYSYI